MAMRRGGSLTRGMAVFAGGAVAAVIASRLLPPVLAQAVGSARAAIGRDPFEALIQDHRDMLAYLNDMEQSPDDAALRRRQLLLRLKRRLTAHALAEEDVIYPMLGDPGGDPDEAKRLYADHADVKMQLHALEQTPTDAPEWRDRVHALRILIESHAREEEEVDFPKLRSALDEQAITRLSGALQREKAMVL